MENVFVNWFTWLIIEFTKFGTWLTTPLQYIGIEPLYIFGFTGLTAIIAILLVRLFVGG